MLETPHLSVRLVEMVELLFQLGELVLEVEQEAMVERLETAVEWFQRRRDVFWLCEHRSCGRTGEASLRHAPLAA
jgi:hypothetical protein